MPTVSAPARTTDFSGLWIPLITPFTGEHNAVDHAALKRLLAHYRGTGIAGYVVCGSTGEAAALNEAEQWAVLDTVLQHADGLPVVMGYSGYNMADALAFVQRANRLSLAGLLIAAPHYIRPSQDGVLHWFESLADASALPLVLYDIPYRTGAHMTLATLRRLAQHPMIQAIKDCGGGAAKTQALIADQQLQVLAGEDVQIFSSVASGARGAISASAHLATEEFAQVIALLQEDCLQAARQRWAPLLPLISALFAEPNPACIKNALAQMDLVEDRLRAPMLAAQTPFDLGLINRR